MQSFRTPAETLIDATRISVSAIKVINRLEQAGFRAYLVGGGVRDLLLGMTPKDFDIATDAHTEEVRDLFRNSRIVGRRFRIVHVRFGREIIEVATFRAAHPPPEDQPATGKRNAARAPSGRILVDNVYGTIDEDAERRDFTMNALYYNPVEGEIRDHTTGIEDIQRHVIRLIGEPERRYREDPVRMLRSIRFAAKLGFEIEPDTARPISRLGHLLTDVPPARLFDEVLKLFMNGHAATTFELLGHHTLLAWLFPDTARSLRDPMMYNLVESALINTDQRIREDLPVTPAFLYAALLWPVLRSRMADATAAAIEPQPELNLFHQTADIVIDAQQRSTTIPRRFSIPMKEIWEMQFRLAHRHGRRAAALLAHKRFRAAYDFLLLREAAGEPTNGLGDWWTRYQQANSDDRQHMSSQIGSGQQRRRRPRTRRSRRPC